jgi:hypothetical protein
MWHHRDALCPIENLSRDTCGWRGHDVAQHFACDIQALCGGFALGLSPAQTCQAQQNEEHHKFFQGFPLFL